MVTIRFGSLDDTRPDGEKVQEAHVCPMTKLKSRLISVVRLCNTHDTSSACIPMLVLKQISNGASAHLSS